VSERSTHVTPLTRNVYNAGELVLLQRDPTAFQPSKLKIQHVGNAVRCRHLATHVERLKIFHGTFQQALDAANQDEYLSVVSHIDALKGDPSLKSTMSFRETFGGGTIVWLPTTSIEKTVPYQTFLGFHPILHHLLWTTAKVSSEWIRSKRIMPITTVKVSDTILVDLRFYGFKWYDEDLT
jgi:hypothetical protein